MPHKLKLKKLEEALAQAWTKKTASAPQRSCWSENNPGVGQSFVTSLLVNDYIGGLIVKGEIILANDGNKVHPHFWNVYDDGERFDLTNGYIPSGSLIEEKSVLGRHDAEKVGFALDAQARGVYVILKRVIAGSM